MPCDDAAAAGATTIEATAAVKCTFLGRTAYSPRGDRIGWSSSGGGGGGGGGDGSGSGGGSGGGDDGMWDDGGGYGGVGALKAGVGCSGLLVVALHSDCAATLWHAPSRTCLLAVPCPALCISRTIAIAGNAVAAGGVPSPCGVALCEY